jgi:hypothetical protein
MEALNFRVADLSNQLGDSGSAIGPGVQNARRRAPWQNGVAVTYVGILIPAASSTPRLKFGRMG